MHFIGYYEWPCWNLDFLSLRGAREAGDEAIQKTFKKHWIATRNASHFARNDIKKIRFQQPMNGHSTPKLISIKPFLSGLVDLLTFF